MILSNSIGKDNLRMGRLHKFELFLLILGLFLDFASLYATRASPDGLAVQMVLMWPPLACWVVGVIAGPAWYWRVVFSGMVYLQFAFFGGDSTTARIARTCFPWVQKEQTGQGHP